MNSGLGGNWTYFLLLVYFYCDGSWLFTLCFIFCLYLVVHIQYPFYYLKSKKYKIKVPSIQYFTCLKFRLQLNIAGFGKVKGISTGQCLCLCQAVALWGCR